jgi:flagellar biosynthesis/type III secretory pathway M-ring protein FliF/YscJ
MKRSLVQWRYILIGCCLASNPLVRAQDRPDSPDDQAHKDRDAKQAEPDNKDPERGASDDKDRGRDDQVKRDDDDKAKQERDAEQKRKADEQAAKEREDRDKNNDAPAR